jgi:uncharacterized integral membrane protein (TIGR00697 family)
MNELLLLTTSIVSAGFILLAWKFNKERLYGVIAINLILISLLGGKIVEFFGYQTNTGNIFYASAFLATYFLIERHGKQEGARSILIGSVAVVFFTIFLKLSIALQSVDVSSALDMAYAKAFDPTFRLAFASVLAYIVSQTVNVNIYSALKHKFEGAHLWLRANISNVVAQAIDSVVFFVIAFWGVVPPDNIKEIILTGFTIKVLFMVCASPLLRLNTMQYEEEKGYSTVTFN